MVLSTSFIQISHARDQNLGCSRKIIKTVGHFDYQTASSSQYIISNKKIYGENLRADTEVVEPFRKNLDGILNKGNVLLSQLYNSDEAGLYWRSLPNNTQASKAETQDFH